MRDFGTESVGNRTAMLHAPLRFNLLLKIVTGSLFIEFHIHPVMCNSWSPFSL